jgi:hypothetical protein
MKIVRTLVDDRVSYSTQEAQAMSGNVTLVLFQWGRTKCLFQKKIVFDNVHGQMIRERPNDLPLLYCLV